MIKNNYCQMGEESWQDDGSTRLTKLPCLDYELPNNKCGCRCIRGGNHGDIAFHFHWQRQLTSPKWRKENNSLSAGCPIIQCGFVKCKKDKFVILENTVMTQLEESRKRVLDLFLITTAMLSVYSEEQSTKTREEIQAMVDCHGDLVGALDALFSHVRGIETCLLPTEADISFLEAAVCKSRELWFQCEIGTLQPKWHVIFDGHLVQQVKLHRGLADKTDDVIELAHQPWKREKERMWNIKNFEMQQKRQLKAAKSSCITKFKPTIHKFRASASIHSNRKERHLL